LEPGAHARVEQASSERIEAMDIPWEHEGSMLRSAAAGEELVARATLHQLVGAFLEMNPEQQRGVAIRVAGPDWTCEYVDAEIRELAARPEYSGAFGRWDSATDNDAPDQTEAASDLLVEAGVSGPSQA
jgi:hypothetical protein